MWRPTLETLGANTPWLLLLVVYAVLDQLTSYPASECPRGL